MSIELPEEVQSVVDAGANRGPVIPGTNMPLPPAQNPAPVPAPPDIAPSAPGSLADKISAAFLTHLAQNQPAPVQSTGQKILAGAQGVLSGLGDAAHASDTRGGWLTGVTNTLNARNQRVAAQNQQQFANQEEKRKNDALIARNQAETVAVQRNTYRQDVDDRNKNYSKGAAHVTELNKSGYPTEHENLSQSAISDLIQKNPNYLQTHYVFATGEEPVFDGDSKPQLDANKNPVMSPLYAVVSRTPQSGQRQGQIEVSPEFSSDLKKFTGQDVPAGTKINVDQFKAWSNDIVGMQDTVNHMNKGRSESLTQDLQRQLQTDLQNENVQHALASVPNNPLKGLQQGLQIAGQHIQAAQFALKQAQQKGDQQGIAQAQQYLDQATAAQKSLQNVATNGFSDKDKEAFAQREETERHNRAEESNKAAELAQKRQQTIVSNLTGDDYLQTLPTQQQSIVRAVGEGRQALPANRKEALALLEQVHQAYPDFDESKVKTWQKASNEYRGSGKTAVQIVPAYNTALEHMQDLYSNTTPEGIFNPLSKAYQDREVALGYVAREVGKAVSAGAMTQKESEELLDTLKGGLTPALKRERVTKTAQLLHDKIDEYQTKFQESAPSSAVKVPVLISPKAAQSYDFVAGKTQQPAAQQQIPSGATHKVPGPDGKMHWTNAQGTVDYGVVQ
jgi:hypothetical protein